MTKRLANTCDDCFFRRAELCAIPGNSPCPTFRAAKSALEPPRQPKLIARPQLAAAAHAAA
jgi:hypothetical protein